ncbi:MAG: N-acetyltransferase [Gammaproteobacteria bacterium]
MNIRILDAADVAAFQSLRLAGLQECPQAFSSSFEEEKDLSHADIAGRLLPGAGHCVFGAFRQFQLVGILGFQCEGRRKLAHKAFIWGMYVAPGHRRTGIGGGLLAAALDHADSLPAIRLVNIAVNRSNSAAVALYRGVGFSEYGVEPDALCVNGSYYDEIQLVRFSRRGSGSSSPNGAGT